MKTVKISEHRARIVEALQNTAYVRETDRKIILVENEIAKIDGMKIPIEVIKDEVYFQGYKLVEITDQALTWSSEGETDIVWRRGDLKSLRRVAEFLGMASQGLTTTWAPKDEIEDFISCRTSEVGANPTVTVRDVNEMVIPPLREVDFLATHFEQAEALAIDLRIIADGRVRQNLKVAFTMKILDSLREVPSVSNTMQQLMMTNDYDFFSIRAVLLKTFCNRARMKSVIKERMATLKFNGCIRTEKFLCEASAILSVITRLYDKEWVLEYSNCVTEIVAKLPSFMRMRIHTKMRELAHEGRWELSLPFDEACGTQRLFDTCASSLTIADLIRKHAEGQLELDELNTRMTGISPKLDKVNRIHDDTADDFAAQFRSTFVIFPRRGVTTEEVNKKLNEMGFKTRSQLSRNQSTYFIAGTIESAERSEKQLSNNKELFGYRAFMSKINDQKN